MSYVYSTAAEAVAASLAAGGIVTRAAYGSENQAYLITRQTGPIWYLHTDDTLHESYAPDARWSVVLEGRLNARARKLTDTLIGEIAETYHHSRESGDR